MSCPVFPAKGKTRIVLSVLSGERAIVEAARRNEVSEQSVSRRKAQFREGARAGIAEVGTAGPSSREEQWRPGSTV